MKVRNYQCMKDPSKWPSKAITTSKLKECINMGSSMDIFSKIPIFCQITTNHCCFTWLLLLIACLRFKAMYSHLEIARCLRPKMHLKLQCFSSASQSLHLIIFCIMCTIQQNLHTTKCNKTIGRTFGNCQLFCFYDSSSQLVCEALFIHSLHAHFRRQVSCSQFGEILDWASLTSQNSHLDGKNKREPMSLDNTNSLDWI